MFPICQSKIITRRLHIQHVHIHPHLWLECKQVVKNVLGRFYLEMCNEWLVPYTLPLRVKHRRFNLILRPSMHVYTDDPGSSDSDLFFTINAGWWFITRPFTLHTEVYWWYIYCYKITLNTNIVNNLTFFKLRFFKTTQVSSGYLTVMFPHCRPFRRLCWGIWKNAMAIFRRHGSGWLRAD